MVWKKIRILLAQIKRDTPQLWRIADPFYLRFTPSRSSQREGAILKIHFYPSNISFLLYTYGVP